MAQRATGFAKKPSAPEAVVAGQLMRTLDEDDGQPRPLALNLAPLIAPYRKHGRLSLRVERLPPRARLTRGHNNGDRSWSLMSDELDGVAYLPPKGAPEACTLGIRIVSLDGGDGATLALLDYPVTPGEEAAPLFVEKPVLSRRATDSADNAELRRLRDDLAEAKEALAASEAELQTARGQGLHGEERASARERELQDHLAAARATLAERENELRKTPAPADRNDGLAAARGRWERELQDQLAAASALAAETLERNRAAWQADQATRFTRSEARAEERIAQARKDGEAALARAQKDWKAAEAARLAAAEAEWQQRSAKALAEAGAQLERAKTRVAAESTRERSDEAERRRLRDEVARLKKSLAARDADLAQAAKDAQAALAEAERKGREREAQNLAAAKTQWQDRSARALAEATAQFERAQSRTQNETERRLKQAEAELDRLRDELSGANDAIADREGDIADIQARLDDQLRETEALRGGEVQLRRLKAELEALRATVAEREGDIVQARTDMEEARLEWKARSEAELGRALSDWKKAEAQRRIDAEAQAEQQAQVQTARVAQRVKQLEAELAQARTYAEALQKRGDSDDIKQLRRDFGHLQALLAERETEIAQLRLDSEHARERWTAEARTSLQKAEHDWKMEAEEAEQKQKRALTMRRTIRDVALVGALSAVAMLLYMRFESGQTLLPAQIAGWIDPSAANRAAVQPAPRTAPARQAAVSMVTIIRSANVRKSPSKSAQIIATVPRNTDLPSLERRGNWVRVKLESTKKEGWVYATFLTAKAAPPPLKRS